MLTTYSNAANECCVPGSTKPAHLQTASAGATVPTATAFMTTSSATQAPTLCTPSTHVSFSLSATERIDSPTVGLFSDNVQKRQRRGGGGGSQVWEKTAPVCSALEAYCLYATNG